MKKKMVLMAVIMGMIYGQQVLAADGYTKKFQFSSLQNGGSTGASGTSGTSGTSGAPSLSSANMEAGPVQFNDSSLRDDNYEVLTQAESKKINPSASTASIAASTACQKVLAARTAAGERKRRSIMDMYKKTIGQRLEQLAKNCKDQIFKTKVPYIGFSVAGIINSIFGAANQVCSQIGQRFQQAQNRAVSGLNKRMPFGIMQSGTRSASIDEISQKGWNPSVKLENYELNKKARQ